MALPILVGLGSKLGILWLGLRRLTTNQLAGATAGWLAVGLTLLYLAIVPDVYSAVYYFTDVAVYQLPALLLVVVPLAVDQAQRAPAASSRRRWLLVAGIGTLAAAGSTELNIVLLGWLILVGFAVSLYRRQAISARIWFGLGVLLLVVGLVGLSAPGNYVRMRVDSAPATSLPQAFRRLVKAVRLVFPSFSLNSVLLLPLLLAPLGVRLLPGRPRGLAFPLLLSTAFLLIGVVLGCLPYAFIWEATIPTRAVNVLLWWLLLGWPVACWAALPMTAPAVPLGHSARLLIALYLTATIALVSWRAWLEWTLEAPQYAQQWQARYTLFRRAAQQPKTKLTIAPMVNITPRHILIHGYDIRPYYHFYINWQTAGWFGLDSVRTDPKQNNRAAF
ncbi:DUF6056 family protein [Hymenobacter cavernae]|uniref:Glycosyltransferase RgtA/B/C/D-like domain-containing protein n=1 Tax=Hymenobacter cavernae TaxID=2044852 RepID=A0ABQ1UVC8_9BACT|nr:hypothetical protein [Hymenobacter cavernae]GGF27964.1 hypothetical protein GCM10011383_44600 [Hymenobacter cavernae]